MEQPRMSESRVIRYPIPVLIASYNLHLNNANFKKTQSNLEFNLSISKERISYFQYKLKKKN